MSSEGSKEDLMPSAGANDEMDGNLLSDEDLLGGSTADAARAHQPLDSPAILRTTQGSFQAQRNLYGNKMGDTNKEEFYEI
jgi:hypothetical protein